MEIAHPRRILIVASAATELSPILNTLVPPDDDQEASADGLKSSPLDPKTDDESAHADRNAAPPPVDDVPVHRIRTPYYSANVPVWTDRISSPKDWAEEWTAQAGAGEVVRAVSAWIVGFPKPATEEDENTTKAILTAVSKVTNHHKESDFDTVDDVVLLAVALPSVTVSSKTFDLQAWDDFGQTQGGWEVIDAAANGQKNEYGETTGLPRLVEALKSAEWDGGDEDLDAMLGLDEGAGNSESEDEPVTEEMRKPILGTGRSTGSDDDDDDQVEELQRMMVQLQAARDMGADLPIGERRKFAARAVREVMRQS